MIRHIVMWTLHDPADAPRFKALLDSCARLVPGANHWMPQEINMQRDIELWKKPKWLDRRRTSFGKT